MTPEHTWRRFETLRAADLIAERTGRDTISPRAGERARRVRSPLPMIEIPYGEIPAMPVPVSRTRRGLVSAMADGYPVLAFTGRCTPT